jgi:hypothetical protein
MVDLLAFSLMTASLSCFLQYCFSEGNIFSRYGLWLEKIPTVIAKPLGLCTYCSNTWLTATFFILVYSFDVKIFLSIGMSYVFLSAIIQLNFD